AINRWRGPAALERRKRNSLPFLNMPTIVLDEWIDLGVIGCRSITVTQKRNTSGNCQVVTITDAEFPQATKDEAYSHLLTAAGGTAPYTFSLVSGTLPTGTTFSGLGLLSGTPTDFGDFTLTIRVEDSAGNFCQKVISLNVDEGAAPPDLLDSLYAVWHFESGTDIFTPDFGVAASILLADGAATTVSAGKLGNAVNINDG